MINFVTEDQDWVLPRYCREFVARIPNSKVSLEVDNQADVNIFLPYYKWAECTTPTIGFYTHKEEDTPQKKEMWELSTQLVDYCIAMCKKTADKLPPEKTGVIQVYPDAQFYKSMRVDMRRVGGGSIWEDVSHKKLILGVAGKECPSGRKRFEFVEELKKIEGVEVKFADGSVPFKDMPGWYDGIDYLVVTSDNEGGSMPVIEALAMFKPVIAPDVGFTWDFPVIRYDGSLEDLLRVVKKLVIPFNGWDTAALQMEAAINLAKRNYYERQPLIV